MLANNLPLVGREPEQATLRAALAEAAGGRGRLVLISGEAGVGKSTLVEQLVEGAGTAAVGVGRCPGAGETGPLGPWLEAVATLQSRARVISAPPDVAQPTAGLSLRQRALELADWAQQFGTPVLFILEDIHWSDPASLDLLRQMGAVISRSHVLIIATYRSDEIQREHPLWTLLPQLLHDGAITLPVHRLDPASVDLLVQGALDLAEPKRRELARELHQRTGGLPLMLLELIKSAQRNGGTLPGEGMLPGTVLQAIDLRLSRLSANALQMLTAAAFIGERFSYAVLAAAVDLHEEVLAEGLEQAIDLHLVRNLSALGDLFEFDHALVREALLARQIAPRRRRWHIRIAEALMRSVQPDPDAVALHLSRADDPRAVEWLLASGDRALKLGALAQARSQYERALQLLQGPDRRRGELLLKLAHTMRYLAPGQAQAYLEEAHEAASEAGDAAVLVWVKHFQVLLSAPAGDTRLLAPMEQLGAEQAALLGDARYLDLEAQLFGQPCGFPRISGERALVLARSGRFKEAMELSREIRAVANPGPHLVDLTYAEHWYPLWTGNYAEATRSLAESRDARLRLKQYRLAASMQFSLYTLVAACRADQPEEVDAAAQEVARLDALAVQRSGEGTMRGDFSPLGYHQFLRGDWAGARRNLLEYFRAHPEDDRGQRRWVAAQLALALDDLEEMRFVIEGCPPHTPDTPLGIYFAQISSLCWRAQLYVVRGELARARAWLDAAAAAIASIPSDVWVPVVQVTLAFYHQAAGDLEAARDAALKAAASAERIGMVSFATEAYRLAGETLLQSGATGLAEPHLRRALALAERCRVPLEIGRAQLALGICLRGQAEGRALLEASRETLAQLGALRYLKQAEAALAAMGEAAATSPQSPLTAREREIAQLVAQGLTDREIGARLFISPKTVDRHLRNIFTKLEITNRSSLVAYAARNGLLG